MTLEEIHGPFVERVAVEIDFFGRLVHWQDIYADGTVRDGRCSATLEPAFLSSSGLDCVAGDIAFAISCRLSAARNAKTPPPSGRGA